MCTYFTVPCSTKKYRRMGCAHEPTGVRTTRIFELLSTRTDSPPMKACSSRSMNAVNVSRELSSSRYEYRNASKHSKSSRSKSSSCRCTGSLSRCSLGVGPGALLLLFFDDLLQPLRGPLFGLASGRMAVGSGLLRSGRDGAEGECPPPHFLEIGVCRQHFQPAERDAREIGEQRRDPSHRIDGDVGPGLQQLNLPPRHMGAPGELRLRDAGGEPSIAEVIMQHAANIAHGQLNLWLFPDSCR